MPQEKLRVVIYKNGQTQSILDRRDVPVDLSLSTTPIELINKLRHLFPSDFRPRVVLLIVDAKRIHKSRAHTAGFGYAQTSAVIRELESHSDGIILVD